MKALADFYGVDLDWLAATAGDQGEGVQAKTAQEAFWLHALRSMPEDERDDVVKFAMNRAKKHAS